MAEITSVQPIIVGGYSTYKADTFPEILQEYLERHGYITHDMTMFLRLARHKSVKKELIQRWLDGKKLPDFQNQLALAKILNVRCGTIFAAVKNRKDV